MQLQGFPRGGKGPEYVVVYGLFGGRRESFGKPIRFGMAFGTALYFSCFLKLNGLFLSMDKRKIDSRWVNSPTEPIPRVFFQAKSPISKSNFYRCSRFVTISRRENKRAPNG